MTISRITPANITATTVTAIITPDVFVIQGLASTVGFSGEHLVSVQILTETVTPLLSVSGEIPLTLICAPRRSASLPRSVAEKTPSNFEVDKHVIVASTN